MAEDCVPEDVKYVMAVVGESKWVDECVVFDGYKDCNERIADIC